MKTLILATLLVAPVAMADVLPTRHMQDKVAIVADSFILQDRTGSEYVVKTDCDMKKVTTFKTRAKTIRQGTTVRVAKDQTCRVKSVAKS